MVARLLPAPGFENADNVACRRTETFSQGSRRFGEDVLEEPGAQTTGLLPSDYGPVRGLQNLGRPAAGRVRGRPRATFRPLFRDPTHGASQAGRQAGRMPWGTDAHARGRASDR